MLTLELDSAQSPWLLIIRYRGRVDPSEAKRCAEEVQEALRSAKPGFRLLVDLTDLEAMDLACAPHISAIMETCNHCGVSEVVRIIPDPRQDIGLQIMSPFHYGENVRITTFKSVVEAMDSLSR